MRVIYMPGVWDLLHVGHVNALEHAKSFGGKLVVGVPTDEVVKEDKGCYPIISVEQRTIMLQSLQCVDFVDVYDELTFIPHLNGYRPCILAVGTTWGTDTRHKQAEQWAKFNGAEIRVVPYTTEISTTEIKNRVIRQYKEQLDE